MSNIHFALDPCLCGLDSEFAWGDNVATKTAGRWPSLTIFLLSFYYVIRWVCPSIRNAAIKPQKAAIVATRFNLQLKEELNPIYDS